MTIGQNFNNTLLFEGNGIQKIFSILFLLGVFSIPVFSSFSSRILVIVLLGSFFVKSEGIALRWRSQLLDSLFYLIVIIAGLIYSMNLTAGLRMIETSFSLLAIPFIFLKADHTNEAKLNNIFYAFIGGVLFACLICIINAFFVYSKTGLSEAFFSYQFTDIINSHPTYLAYYLIFSITFGLHVLYYRRVKVNFYIAAAVLVFLFIVLLLTGGRTSFISILLVFSFFILRFLIGDKKSVKRTIFILVLLMTAGMFFASSVDFGNKIALIDDSWERFVLWESAINATPSIFWGAGTGDSKLLNEYYLSHNMSQFAEGSYNAHNQFIQIFFTNGILGLLAVLIMIGRPLYLSVRHQNTLGVLVFFPFLIYGMTEVFLGRYQGVVFFALLHQCFITHYQSDARALALKSS